jgi:hypothetical protein
MSSSVSKLVGVSTTSPDTESDISIVRRGCGILHTIRVGHNTTFVRIPCGKKSCTRCGPKVIGAKMDATPDTELFYARMTADEFKNGLGKQLARQRAKGLAGDYRRIPVGYNGEMMIISDAEIGHSISREDMEAVMMASRTEWGAITCSKAWRPEPRVAKEHTDDYQYVGIATTSLEWIEAKAKRMGLMGHEGDMTLSFRTTPAQHAQLMLVAGVKSPADYWADVRANGSGGDWMDEFVGRVCASKR